MLFLRPLPDSMGESCLGKGQNGCLGTAPAPVWPSTAIWIFRTRLYMAQESSPTKQEHTEDRYFTEKIQIKLSLCLNY